jgi:ribosomal protein L37AE/L43A
MFSCPDCTSQHIMVIDLAEPPMVFECANCRKRFHESGFTPQEIDAQVSLGDNERLTLDNLLQR